MPRLSLPIRSPLFALYLLLIFALFGCSRPKSEPDANPQIHVVVDGLVAPVGMAVMPDGGLLVAEEGTGMRDDSAGVTLVSAEGEVGRLISGLPSTRDAGDLAGVPMVALSPAGDKLYLANFGQGHLWTLPLTPEQQKGLLLPHIPLTTEQLTPEMLPLNNVRLTNPFDIAFDEAGTPVVSDASQNGVAKENPNGTTRFIHRFEKLPNPVKATDPVDAVPTGITRIGDEYYVTLTGGCPYPEKSGQLVAIDEKRNQRTVVDGLNMPIDVAQGADGTIWLLEFAQFTPDASCFTGDGYRPKTGRLSRLLEDGSLEPLLTDLNYPASVLPMPDGSLYVSEVFPGRILHITFGASPLTRPVPSPAQDDITSGETLNSPSPSPVPTVAIDSADYDQHLLSVIKRLKLEPNPGGEVREGDTPLARLGQALFFDPILSGDRNISCATCHHPTLAMADGRVLPIGTGGEGIGPPRSFMSLVSLSADADAGRYLRVRADPERGETLISNPFNGHFVPRNSPTILNSALLPTQFWDSRIESYALGQLVESQDETITQLELTDPLAAQALHPLTSLHEMAGATFGELPPQQIRRLLLTRLRNEPAYVALFDQLFGQPDDVGARKTTEVVTTGMGVVTLRGVAEALAAFERRFVFTDAPWDDYLGGERKALSEQQKRGALLFFGELDPAVNCAQCHSGPLFTDLQHYNLLVPQLGPGKGHGYSKREDWGRGGVSFDARDQYRFRTPSLRNVELTAPYFHSGAFATLTDTIRHHADIRASASGYDPSAHHIPPALYSSLRPFETCVGPSASTSPQREEERCDARLDTAAPTLWQGLPLNETQISDLVAFLNALTDPAARDLTHFIPQTVPSDLPLDSLPQKSVDLASRSQESPHPPTPSPNTRRGGEDEGKSSNSGQEMAAVTSEAGLQLHNVAEEVGIDFQHGAFRHEIYQDPIAAMGGGLCWIDYNRDGWLDLYLVNSHAEEEIDDWEKQGGLPRNALYRNDGGTFTDVSAESGADLAQRGNGCVAADFDLDGWYDLYLTADGPNALLWNNGDGTFSEGAQVAGIDAPEWNSAAVVGDLDQDGWPDLFVAAYIDLNRQIPKPVGAFPGDYYGLPDRLYLNNGPTSDGRVTFREVTQLAGLERQERGLGALLSDLDQDGDLDLYIANDGQPNRLYENQQLPDAPTTSPLKLGGTEGGRGTEGRGQLAFRLIDLTNSANVGDSGSGMGVAGGDYDGDGLTDLFITNWERELNALYRNESAAEGHLTFQYSTFRIGISGLGNGVTGWGTALADLDHDTDADLLIINGRVPVTSFDNDPELVRFYRNRSQNMNGPPGRPGHFLDATEQIGLKKVGPILGRGSALADFDNDGDLDVAINTIGGAAILLQSNNLSGNSLQIALEHFQPGTRVTLELPDGRHLVRESYAGSSYLASEDPRLHFGLGTIERVPRVIVHWPDGQTTEWQEMAHGLHTISQP
ncbi:MAG: ScyD/ScyE family protein [Ardenticatenaceae bacterium]